MIRNLLSLGITLGLSDRESFVSGFSELIKDYQDDPQKAEKISNAFIESLKQFRDNTNTRENMRTAFSDIGVSSNKSLMELTKAVQELTVEIKRHR